MSISGEREYLSLFPRFDEKQLNSCLVAFIITSVMLTVLFLGILGKELKINEFSVNLCCILTHTTILWPFWILCSILFNRN